LVKLDELALLLPLVASIAVTVPLAPAGNKNVKLVASITVTGTFVAPLDKLTPDTFEKFKPVTVMVLPLYALVVVPLLGEAEIPEMTGAPTIVILRLRVAVQAGVFAVATCIVKLDVPPPVGVPDITPVDAFNVKPAGNVPLDTDHVYGVVPPLADNA
jgi:hypothetical protein